jgi:hypothetical protein
VSRKRKYPFSKRIALPFVACSRFRSDGVLSRASLTIRNVLKTRKSNSVVDTMRLSCLLYQVWPNAEKTVVMSMRWTAEVRSTGHQSSGSCMRFNINEQSYNIRCNPIQRNVDFGYTLSLNMTSIHCTHTIRVLRVVHFGPVVAKMGQEFYHIISHSCHCPCGQEEIEAIRGSNCRL